MSHELCPKCRGPVKPVFVSSLFLNPEQCHELRAGDVYCEKCPGNDRGREPRCYWWKHELTGPILPSPFYECDDAVIYCGDAFDLLPLIEADACITDPPYGINYKSGHNTGYVNKREGWDEWRRDDNFAPIAGDDKPFDPSPLMRFNRVAICGANYFASRLPDSRCWITWDKREDSGSDRQSDCEMVWTNFGKPSRVFRHLWRGLCRRGEENVAKSAKKHPHQKPVALMRWLMEYGEVGPVVVDPFMGSGSTLLAARDSGLRSIGIEVSEEYCEAAVSRLRNRPRQLLPT